MQPVKINLYISYAPEDRLYLENLLRWLYPMRDEVNIWYEQAPPPPTPLPLPWQILLFWYAIPDQRRFYYQVLAQQVERAHIYLFLTSYRSLSNKKVEYEITRAVQRHIDIGDRFLRIFPVLLSPSRWQDESRLARYAPLGPPVPLSSMRQEEDGYLALTNQLSNVIHTLKRNLDEQKYAVARGGGEGELALQLAESKPQPDVGSDPEAVTYLPDEGFRPPEWLGWVILIAIILVTLGSLGPKLPSSRTLRYLNAEPADQKPPEYLRQNPMNPPPALPFPPADDSLFIKPIR